MNPGFSASAQEDTLDGNGRTLTLTRLRAKLSMAMEVEEQDQQARAAAVGARLAALLHLKRNADRALSELKASNERRARKEKNQMDTRLQETVALLSQGLNPYEHFRRRDMEKKKQQELNRIAAMSAKRREDVRQLVIEDERQYNKSNKKKTKKRSVGILSTQEQKDKPKSSHPSSLKNNLHTTDENTDKEKFTDDTDTNTYPKKKFALHLPHVNSKRENTADSTLQASMNHLQASMSATSVALNTQESRAIQASGIGEASTRSIRVDSSYADFPSTESKRDIFVDSNQSYPASKRDGYLDYSVPISKREGLLSDQSEGHKKSLLKPLSVLEQKMMERTMQSMKNNITEKQVVMNKEFEGKSFITKPSALVFDDFEIGRTYTRKISVTNVSLSFNTVKVLKLPARVNDFFKVSYDPPGRLSAGTGVTIEVTFTPVLPTPVNENLIILAKTGQFEIPIECTPKQCKVSLSSSHVEFDNISLGETQSKIIKVVNNGGLESKLDLTFDVEACSLDNNATEDQDDSQSTATIQSAFTFDPSSKIIKPYSSLAIEIFFHPKVLGLHHAAIVITHLGTNNTSTETRLQLSGMVSDVPIYLSSREVDLRVCYCNQLYREVVVLNNRGKTALKATMKVPGSLKKYIECVPKVAFVQAHSSLSVQLKFKPTLDLLASNVAEIISSSISTLDVTASSREDNQTHIRDTDELKASQPCCPISMAISVEVASQCSPISFMIKAMVTNPTLSITPPLFDFGECSINESVSIPFIIHNHSIVSIKYGFVRLPNEIHVYPAEGFGTLLPSEEKHMTATFSPFTSTQHNFSLTVKTDQGKIVTVPCNGTGVKPALQFSPAVVSLPPTSLGDINSAFVFLENISKVPQIFEICVPEDCPFLQITPIVQTILPGNRTHIKIDFEPSITKIYENDSHSDALNTVDPQEELKLQGDTASRSLKTKTYSKKSSSKTLSETVNPSDPRNKVSTPEYKSKKKRTDVTVAAGEMVKVQSTSKPSFTHVPPVCLPEGKHLTWKISCFSKPAKLVTLLKESQVSTETPSMVYLEISASVAPPILVRVLEPNEQDNYLCSGRLLPTLNPPMDFGQVPVGQRKVKKLIIKNNSINEIKPQLEALYGTMAVLNAVRPMLPNQSQVLQIQYKPDTHGMHVESLEFTVGKHHRLVVPVQGQGVEPKLSIEPNDDVIDLGPTMAKDCSKKEIKLVNSSQFVVGYQINLLRAGPRNTSGINPFSVVPAEGDVPVGGERIVTILFEPDHENTNFYDVLQIEVKSENSKRTITLKGKCTGSRSIYLLETGYANEVPTSMYSANASTNMLKDACIVSMNNPIRPGHNWCVPRGSLTIDFDANDTTGVRTLTFGNTKSKQREKSIAGEVILEPFNAQALKDGFSVDTNRLVIDADFTKAFTFKFDPNSNSTLSPKKIFGSQPNSSINTVENIHLNTVDTSVKCTVKGSATDKDGTSFTLLLRGYYKCRQ